MRIHNEITLQAPADELFEFLSDVERVGPCLPGATIEGRDGEDYAGRMKVKVGPINATYQGKLRFLELDKDARRAVMRARAEEVNGQGNAEASITTEVEDADGENSVIRMDTDLQIRGKVAQFGRGAMEKISQRMFEQFAGNIEQAFNGDGAAARGRGRGGGRAGRPRARPGARAGGSAGGRRDDDGQALDVFGMLGTPNLAKAGPVVAVALVALGYGYPVRPAAGVPGHGAEAGAAAVSAGADPLELSLVAAADALRRGELDVVELTEACLARAEATSSLGAFALLDHEGARRQAAALAGRGRAGRCTAPRSRSRTSSTSRACRPAAAPRCLTPSRPRATRRSSPGCGRPVR